MKADGIPTADKLRNEIQAAKGYRHEFVMKKFAFGAILLGLGSLSGKAKGLEIDFLPLAYLVPLIALAFDLYIVVEDYRIKHAGEFVRSELNVSGSSDRDWELFCHAHPNHASSYAFAIVTMLYLAASSIILYQAKHDPAAIWSWISIVILLEICILGWGVRLRTHLANSRKNRLSTT